MYHNGGYSNPVDWNSDREVDRWGHEESRRMTKDEKAGAVVAGALAVGILAAAAADQHRTTTATARVPAALGASSASPRAATTPTARWARRATSRSSVSSAARACQYNRSWGYDRRGIWVGDGCRAEFWVD